MSRPVSGFPHPGPDALTPPPPPARVKVWDPVVRLFHWTVALGCVANLTVLREVKSVHRYVGYVMLAAVAVRLVWGLVGGRHARFSDFVPSPGRLLGYLKALARREEPRYIGHNPAGALMMLALIGLVAACGITGWMMGLDAYWGVGWVETLHEVAANSILGLAILHVLAALVESWRHRENLVLAMVTGLKRAPQGNDVSHAPAAR
jgi:cytochrome b